jgi:uncharacterized protein (TIGR03435 family)
MNAATRDSSLLFLPSLVAYFTSSNETKGLFMRARHLLLLATVATSALYAQSGKTFEVISIKANRSGAPGSDTNTTPGRLSLMNVTPLSLIIRAFGILNPQIIDAPGWLSTERYDIVAVTAGAEALTDKTRQPFIQAMLAERWQFRFHREMRSLSVYSLVVARNGVKLSPYNGAGEYAMKVLPAGDHMALRSTKGNIPRLVEILSGLTGSLVTNDTGLSGEYDFTLEWVQDPNSDAAAPALFTALQEQLGLKLEASKKPMEVIVIDHIERPSEN